MRLTTTDMCKKIKTDNATDVTSDLGYEYKM